MARFSRQPERIAAVDAHGQQVQAMFSDIAHGYDRANRMMSLGTDVRWRRQAVRLLQRSAEAPPQHVLDLCAGTLDSSKEIHRAFPNAQIIGGDFSQGMLDAGARTLSTKQRAMIEPMAMDAHALPIASASQDALFCAFGVRNLSDLAKASAEQARVLKSGGRLVVLDFFRPEEWTTRVVHTLYNSTVLPAVGWMMTGNLSAYLYLPQSIGKFCSSTSYAELLRSVGFCDVNIIPLTLGVASIVTANRPHALTA